MLRSCTDRTNDDRAERVAPLIDMYQGGDGEFQPRDLICDIGHWMDRNPGPEIGEFRGECFAAMDHYEAETSDDAEQTNAAQTAAAADDEWRVWVLTREDEHGDASTVAVFSSQDTADGACRAVREVDALSIYKATMAVVDGDSIQTLVGWHVN